MFSSDIRKIRIAELKSKGEGGKIQRLRKTCDDAAAIMDHTAALLIGKPLPKKTRIRLANLLRRGVTALRGTARFSPPKGAK